MFGLGFGELLLILIIVLLFIGPKKLPELAKSLGRGIREFQKASKGEDENTQVLKQKVAQTENTSEELEQNDKKS
ncbi:MAG: twin-arginine translocase TatA/TatE family subunit [Bacteriovoracaceae bacterium]|nr:twin-arginine translocase TatA/TatE family subunit [Bacteriovoracaceae bacterium]